MNTASVVSKAVFATTQQLVLRQKQERMSWTLGLELIRKQNASLIATTTQDVDTTHGTQTDIGIRNSASSSLLVTASTVSVQTVVLVPGLRKISALHQTTKSYAQQKDGSLLKKKKERQDSTVTDLM